MAITTLAGVVSGLQTQQYFAKGTVAAGANTSGTTWGNTTFPLAGSFNSTLNGVTLSSPQTGQIPWTDPNTGNGYLARFTGNTSSANNQNCVFGILLLCDRLWHNGGIDITGASSPQTIVSPTWPSRDINGATSGEGIILAYEISVTTGAGSPTLTAGYTNSAGTSGRTGVNVQAITTAQGSGTAGFFGLQAGDTGVQSVQSISLSSTWTSGTMNLVALRVIAVIPVSGAGIPSGVDAITSAMPRMYAGSVPYLMYQYNLFGNNVNGEVAFTWG